MAVLKSFAWTCVSALVLALALAPAASAQTGASSASEGLDEIVVTTSLMPTPRRRIGAALSVIDKEEIELRGYDELADLLRTAPGIGVSNSGGPGKQTAVRVRGEESYRTLLVVDGIRILDPSQTQVAPRFDTMLVTSDLERIEILRGPQGFIHGADAGGVINVLTRTGAGEPELGAAIEGGSFGTQRYSFRAGGGSTRGDFFFSASDYSTDGFNAQTADTLLADDDAADNRTLHAKLGWNPTERLRLELVARDTDASVMYDGCFATTVVYDCLGDTRQSAYRLAAERDNGPWKHVFAYSGVDIERLDVAGGAPAFATDGELDRLEYIGSWSNDARGSFVYGLDLQDERVVAEESDERDQRAYYVEYQGAAGTGWYYSVGARYDDHDGFGTHTSSRVSVAHVQTLDGGREIKYRASYGTGFRAPSLFELAYNDGPFAAPPASEATLMEETSRGLDVGVEYLTSSGWRLEAGVFEQRIEDELFFDLVGFSGYLQSAGTSRSRGVELGAHGRLSSHWELLANWTTNDAETVDGTARLRRPEQLGNFGVTYGTRDSKLRLMLAVRLARDAVDVGNVPLDDYEVVDVALSYRIASALEIFGRLQNAADEEYTEVVGHATAGRALYTGLRARF